MLKISVYASVNFVFFQIQKITKFSAIILLKPCFDFEIFKFGQISVKKIFRHKKKQVEVSYTNIINKIDLIRFRILIDTKL